MSLFLSAVQRRPVDRDRARGRIPAILHEIPLHPAFGGQVAAVTVAAVTVAALEADAVRVPPEEPRRQAVATHRTPELSPDVMGAIATCHFS